MKAKHVALVAAAAACVLVSDRLVFLAHASTHPELGAVDWGRDLARARARARETSKPILILFDEVPGCQTCVRYGQAVLTHPLLVDAAETEFVPLAVFNNLGGEDRKVLQAFGEPSWNNPVVRVVDANLKPLAPRLAGNYDVSGLAQTMVAALKAHSRPVPPYLASLPVASRPPRAIFSMYCFWTGEACIGDIEGVVATRTGFLGGREVVEVSFDPGGVSRSELYRRVARKGCATHVFVRNEEERREAEPSFRAITVSDDRLRGSPKDDKHALRRSAARYLPLTPGQASRVNARIAEGEAIEDLLSPSQRSLWRTIQQHPGAGWRDVSSSRDLASAFESAERTRARLSS
ncbi:MAG: VPGUxxT family thioredoxin-like (seleno)protein, type 2 [Myxococcota bacterium]